MLIVVTEPCCKRGPFEGHKEDCYYNIKKRLMDKFIKEALEKFGRNLRLTQAADGEKE